MIDPKKDALEPLLPSGAFLSPQTPALSNDRRVLYVPDYTQGIAAVRLADHTVEWLKADSPAATFAVDGMYPVEGGLIAIQNGTLPERIVEFSLGTPVRIASWKVLEANTPYLGDPTHGVFVGRDFYFIVKSG